jgi:hypothetical protein
VPRTNVVSQVGFIDRRPRLSHKVRTTYGSLQTRSYNGYSKNVAAPTLSNGAEDLGHWDWRFCYHFSQKVSQSANEVKGNQLTAQMFIIPAQYTFSRLVEFTRT